jgi:hypothetical protein
LRILREYNMLKSHCSRRDGAIHRALVLADPYRPKSAIGSRSPWITRLWLLPLIARIHK